MKTETLQISYADEDGNEVTDAVRVRRLKVLARAKIFDDARKGEDLGQAMSATAHAKIGIGVIAASVLNDENDDLKYTFDVIAEEWDANKVAAYKTEIDTFQKPSVREAGKGSTATPIAPSS